MSKRKRLKAGTVVSVCWEDCVIYEPGWMEAEDVRAAAAEESAIVSVGFVVEDRPGYLVIGMNVGQSRKNVAGCTKIPRAQIRRVEVLQRP